MQSASGKNLILGLAALVATVMFFTAFVVATRAGVRTQLGPWDLTALRFGVAALLLLPVFARHRLLGLRWHDAIVLALCGGGGFALTAYAGIQLAPPGHGSALLHGTLPLSTLVLQSVLGRRAPRLAQVLAVLVICSGIALLLVDAATLQGHGGGAGRELTGQALLLGASLLWSSYGMAAARLQVPPLPGAALVAVVSCALYLPVYGLTRLAAATGQGPDLGLHALAGLSWHDILLQAFIQGVLVSVVGNIVYIRAVRVLGASRVAAGLAVTPGVAALVAWALLGEQPSAVALAGVALVMTGVFCASVVAHRMAQGVSQSGSQRGSQRELRP